MKNYLGEQIDLTGDAYLNPVPAVYDNGLHIRNTNQIKSISVHHDATFRRHDYDSVAVYKKEAAEHYARLGPGLQYHYRIDNVGQIFHVRPLTTWLYAVGSAENMTMLAICLDGNFETQQPTREQLEALYQLLENLCEQHPEFPAEWPDVRPHQSYSATACCGLNLRNRIYAIEDKSSAQAQLLNQGEFDWPANQPGSVPTPAPTPPAAPDPTPPPEPAPAPPVVDDPGMQDHVDPVPTGSDPENSQEPDSTDIPITVKPVPDSEPANQTSALEDFFNLIVGFFNWLASLFTKRKG